MRVRAIVWIQVLIVVVGTLLTIKKTVFRDVNDFYIYFGAAQELFEDGVNLYRTRGELAAYPYPHFFLLPFYWLSFLPVKVVAALWSFGLGCATLLLLRAQYRLILHYGQVGLLVLIATPLLFSRTITHNYSTAQASLWIAALAMMGWSRIVDDRQRIESQRTGGQWMGGQWMGGQWMGGMYLGLAAAIKLTPMAYLLVLVVERRWRAIVAMLVTVVLAVLILPALFMPIDRHLECLTDFFDAMIMPLFGGGHALEKNIWHSVSGSIAGTWPALFPTSGSLPPNYAFLKIATVSAETQSLIKVSAMLGATLLAGLGIIRAAKLRVRAKITSHSERPSSPLAALRSLDESPDSPASTGALPGNPPSEGTTIACPESELILAPALSREKTTVHRIAIISLLIALLSPLTRIYHLPDILLAGGIFLLMGRASTNPMRRVIWWSTIALVLVTFPLKQKSIFGDNAYIALSTVAVNFLLFAMLAWLALCSPIDSRAEDSASETSPDRRVT